MKVYELLSDESKWTQGVNARDETGVPVNVNSKKAVRWCAQGAIHKCYPLYTDYLEVVEELRNKIRITIEVWNDSVSYEEVIGVFKEIDR